MTAYRVAVLFVLGIAAFNLFFGLDKSRVEAWDEARHGGFRFRDAWQWEPVGNDL